VSTGPTLSYRAEYSYATFDQIRQHSQPFGGALAYDCCAESPLTIGAETQTVFRLWGSGDSFTTLGVPALLGRTVT
jgi:hypothetical protein